MLQSLHGFGVARTRRLHIKAHRLAAIRPHLVHAQRWRFFFWRMNMPCRGPEIVDPSEAQKYRQNTAKCLVIARTKLGLEVPGVLTDSANDGYCRTDFTSALCGLIRQMDDATMDSVVYNAKDRDSRRLADWWEFHQEVDRKREAEEKAKADKEELKRTALAKLTSEEKIALGLLAG